MRPLAVDDTAIADHVGDEGVMAAHLVDQVLPSVDNVRIIRL